MGTGTGITVRICKERTGVQIVAPADPYIYVPHKRVSGTGYQVPGARSVE